MNIFTRDRQIISSPQIDEIEEAIVQFFNQIVASAEEIPRVNITFCYCSISESLNFKLTCNQ